MPLNKETKPNQTKKLKFDHMNKWYMHNQEFTLENEILELLWNFEIQTDHLILARWSHLVIVNKKKKENLAYHKVKFKESEKKDKYLDLARELKKTMEHEGNGDTNCNWCI